jgi:ABC-type sugar transport system ATPase subunit
MQDGRVTLEQETRQITEQALVDAIVGESVARRLPSSSLELSRSSKPILRVRGLSLHPLVSDVSFDLYGGEILGLAGLVGSGRSEVARMICGAEMPSRGTIELDGRPTRFRNPVDAIRRGIALLPEDRRHEGLVLNFGVRENITLASLPTHRVHRLLPFPHRSSERSAAAAIAERLAIATPGIEREVRRLSGGNQQKVVLAKWLQKSGRVLVFDEPTQGVDVGAKAEIFALIQELAREGRGIVVISSDFAELVTACTRVVALREGRVSGTLTAPHITEEALVRLAYGATGPDVASGVRGSERSGDGG